MKSFSSTYNGENVFMEIIKESTKKESKTIFLDLDIKKICE